MTIKEPPVCSRCADQPDSVAKLEQHVRVPPRKGFTNIKSPTGLLDGASERVSLTHPLSPAANKTGLINQGQQLPPPWMTLLPSNRHPATIPPETLNAAKRTHSSTMQNKVQSTSFSMPPQYPTINSHGPLGGPSRLSPSKVSTSVSLASPEAIILEESHEVDEPPMSSSSQQGLQATRSTHSSESPSRSILTPTPNDSAILQTDPKNGVRRNFSIPRGMNTLRRSSTNKSVAAPARSCGPSEMHTPVPSQSSTLARTPFFRELSSFFSSRAKKGKLALPSRLGSERSSTNLNESGRSTPAGSRLQRSCEKCGVDTSGWWMGREPGDRGQGHELGRADRMCEFCKATEPTPRSMPGAWD